MEVTIRPATVNDAAGVLDVLNPIIETGSYTAFDTPFTLEEERAFISTLPERGIFHVAEHTADPRIVGLQTLTPFADYTRAFDHVGVMGTFVVLGYHRQGIAAQLFDATYLAARGLGYEKIFAFVRADNRAGLAAYAGQGFRIIGTAERQARINGRYIDEIIIEKWIA
jgi:L-amino acid N-acyltransferase YncA